MAKLTDPDSLTLAVNATATTEEVEIQTAAKTIEFRVAGNLDDTAPGKTSGLTGRCAYSFLKEEWLANPTLRRHRFPFKMIFEGSFIVTNGWKFLNAQSHDLVRDAGYEHQFDSTIRACMISLGDVDAPGVDLAYYTQVRNFTATTTDYDKTGELNENVDITGLTTFNKTFLREQGKVYAEYELLGQLGISSITFQAYSFPLSNGTDLKITETDGNIDTIAPYTGMEINYIKGNGFTTWTIATVYPAEAVVQDQFGRWFFTLAGGTSAVDDTNLAGGSDTGVTWVTYFGEELIGSTYYAFNREVDANGGTDIEAHEFMSRQLRQVADINDNTGITVGQDSYGTVNGEVGRLLSTYVGDTLLLEPGVVLRNFDANSTNNINHQPITVDTAGLDADDVPQTFVTVAFPFVSAGNFNFASNIVDEADVDTVYTVYFDYITRTSGSYTLTLSATDTGDLTWASTDLDHIQAGDYLDLSGFVTNTTNDGLYLVNTVGANTMNITHQAGTVLITETAAIQVDENPFDTDGAIIVDDNSGTDMDGQVTGATIAWDFAYTNNVQGGRAANTNAPCTLVAIAKNGAEWVEANFTITKAAGINVPVNPADERNYNNP